jgi:predicted MPP superfamily phosphohydrolase
MKLLPKSGLSRSLAIILLVALVPASLGYMYHEGDNTQITVLHIDGAPEGIVFISDPHLRDANLAHVKEAVRQVNALHPSVVLIGGDFTYRGAEDLPLNDVWKGIDAPVYAILGNHDYQAGLGGPEIVEKTILVRKGDLCPASYNVSVLDCGHVDTGFADLVTGELSKDGVRVLRNEVADLDIGGRKLAVVGLDDCWAGQTHPPAVTASDAFTIYLIHEPDCAAAWPGADLILAGHTHGGQFATGITQALNTAGVLELSGMKIKDGVPLYITRGIGTSNFNTEVRFMEPPEIVVINPVPGAETGS